MFAANPKDVDRRAPEEQHPFRDDFERDRDRILYSKEFRRLSGKTQVFITGFDDHLRTRLTHTLEVSQIARTIAKRLDLNVTLSEAIALAHDLGHTPFGHVGERTLNYIMNGCDKIKDFNDNISEDMRGFKHNYQGIRVVTELEKIDKEYDGLNLTQYTLWGILHHSKIKWGKCKNIVETKCNLRHNNNDCNNNTILKLDFYNKYNDYLDDNLAWTFEALVVRWADEIAQRHHDIEDALEAKIINKDELIKKLIDLYWNYFTEEEKIQIEKIKGEEDKTFYLPAISKFIVNFLVTNLVDYTEKIFIDIKSKYSIENDKDFLSCKANIKLDYSQEKNKKEKETQEEKHDLSIYDLVSYEPSLKKKDDELQKYLANRILNSHLAQRMDGKSNFIIRQLFKAFATNPQQLPDKTILTFYNNYLPQEVDNLKDKSFEEKVGTLRDRLKKDHFELNDDTYKKYLLRTICDYIAGMTDQYAIEQYKLLY